MIERVAAEQIVSRTALLIAFALLLGLALALLSGCHLVFPFNVDEPARDAGADGPPADSFVPPDGSVIRSYHFPARLLQKLDVLFVVDNSDSMIDEQRELTQAFSSFVDALDQGKAGLPDLHIGVISTDIGAGDYNLPSCELVGGDKGELQNAPRVAGCSPPSERYISHAKGVTNVPGAGSPLQKIKSAFNCIAQLGAGGCGFEQTIEAARWAVDPKLDTNPGFVRTDALLVLVFVTDEDDCSAARPELFDPKNTALGPLTSYRCFQYGVSCTCPGGPCATGALGPRTDCKPSEGWLHPISGYTTLFKELKPAGQVVVAALAGPSTPVVVELEDKYASVANSCERKGFTAADPGIRLQALLDSFGTASLYSSICAADYDPPLKKLGAVIAAQMGSACLRGLIDTDPGVAGMQASCTVRDVQGSESKAVPACDNTSETCKPCPCWRVQKDADCAALGGYRLEVVRSKTPTTGLVVEASCLGPGD